MTSHLTAGVKGGSPKLKVLPNPPRPPPRKLRELKSASPGGKVGILAGLRHHYEAAMAMRVGRAHAEDHIILGNGQRDAGHLAHRFGVLPLGSRGGAPDHLIARCVAVL